MSALQRAATIVVAVLAVAILAVLVLGAAGAPIGRGPDGSPTPTAPASPPSTSSPTPGPSVDPTAPAEDETLATLAEIEEQVIALRGLPAAGIGPPDLINRNQLVEELERLFEADYPPEEREQDNIVLRAFGLLEPDQDVGELQLQLLGDQVLGFYDDVEKRMVVVSDAGLDAEAKLTYAHEYTHALQDAAFGLATLETDAVGEDDRSLARIALIEGDATVTMLAWAVRHLSQQELIEISGQPVPDTSGIPTWMVNQLTFPYVAGQAWAGQLAGPDPLAPDFEEVDAAYADPPDSTAQIIDIDKWYADVEPVEVEVPDLAAALGDDWEQVDSSAVGQASIGIILEHFGAAPPVAAEASDQWAGDRAVVAAGPNDEFALVWVLAWETSEDASDFEEAYGDVVSALPFPAVVSDLGGGEVLVVHASDADLLRRALDAAR